MFSNKDLKNLIIPLFLEQLLLAFVGIADVFVIGFVGEAAVSGVSLVNSFNTIFLNLFTALAAGGAVVISQYIGRKDREHATQLLTASILLSVVIAVVVLIDYKCFFNAVSLWKSRRRCYGSVCYLLKNFCLFLSSTCDLQCRSSSLSKFWKDKHNDVYFNHIKCD